MDSAAPVRPPGIGAFGEELIVISRPEIRVADELTDETLIDTPEGAVKGRVGDFTILTESAERYPIPREIFLGAYEVLGRVGTRYVGRRLLHARRAWPILSASAEFNYGADRATVVGERGGWIYQSDDEDYGLIKSGQNVKSHLVAGPARKIDSTDWESRFRVIATTLIFLPPVMVLLALAALRWEDYHKLLHAVEGALLVVGLCIAWWAKHQKWAARAAIASADRVSCQFQVAAEMLGERRSTLFPGMSLWRAAQSNHTVPTSFQARQVRELKDRVSSACENAQHDMERNHAAEGRASVATLAAAVMVLGCIGYLVLFGRGHGHAVAYASLWLPALVGALHTLNWNRQVVARKDAASEFLTELRFIRGHLFELVPGNDCVPDNTILREKLAATLRTICRVSAEHAQRELRHAIGIDPSLPV